MEEREHVEKKNSAILRIVKTPFFGGILGGVLGASLVLGASFFFFKNNTNALVAQNTQAQPAIPTENAPTPVTPIAVPRPPVPSTLSTTEVVRKVNPSVVSIEVKQQVPVYETIMPSMNDFFGGFFFGFPQERRQIGTREQVVGKGTGFFVSQDGYIVTNRHVVDQTGEAVYEVTTTEGKKLLATVVVRDETFDVAVLKVSGRNFPAVTFGNSDKLELGESVVAIGFALGEFQNSVSVGIISGLSRSIVASGGGRTAQLDRVIQTDAAINPGNSGGPLINLRGEVIGVNVATAQGAQSIGFALPANAVRAIVERVR